MELPVGIRKIAWSLFVSVVVASGFGRTPCHADTTTTLGTKWTLRRAPAGLQTVAFGAGKFVALGGGKLATSPDGVTWTERSAPPGMYWSSLVYAKGKFVAVSSEGNDIFPQNVMTSLDGITWIQAPDNVPGINRWVSLAFGKGLFVAGGDATYGFNSIMTSADGVTWSARSVPSLTGYYSVGYGNNVYVAAAFSNGLPNVIRLQSSSDAITWTARELPSGVSPNVEFTGVTFGNGQFLAVGFNQTILTSKNGITWSNRSLSGSFRFTDVVYGQGVFIAFAAKSDNDDLLVMRSLDGKEWTQQKAPTTVVRTASTYAHGVIVGLSNQGTNSNTIMTSGTFGVTESIVFSRKSARLSARAQRALLAALRELDSTLKIKARLSINTDKPIGGNSLASRRALAVVKFLKAQTSYSTTASARLTRVKKVPASEANAVKVVLSYR